MLPEPNVVREPDQPDSTATADERIKILFVEDDPINTQSFVTCFSEEYEILTAESGPEALEIFSREDDIAMVISDQRMEPMSGVELLSRIYAIRAETMRIIITGYLDVSDVIDAINEGHIYQYILKPWDIIQLRLILGRASQNWRLTRENRQLNEELRRNNALLQEANSHLQESEKRLRSLSNALLHAQENERKRISMELHDELGQSLAALKLQIKVLENEITNKPDQVRTIRDRLQALRLFVDEIIENVRRLSKNLSPIIIDDLGLDAALENLVANFSRYYGIECNLQSVPLGHLFSGVARHLIYRLIQEALNNVGKHSGATRMDIVLENREKEIAVTLRDNGRGFDVNEVFQQPASNRGIGLTAMSERVNMLGGSIHIDSTSHQGTTLHFRIPIQADFLDIPEYAS